MRASEKLTAVATVCALVCTAAVLRAPITSMGTLSMAAQGDLGFSATTMGLLTTLPLLAFAASALFMGAIANRFGKELVLAIGCALVLVGLLVRSFLGGVGLVGGTVLMGLGISAGNVLLPAIVKDRFPLAIGTFTAIYTTTMSVFAGGAAGASSLLVEGGMPWQTALALTAPLAAAALLIWGALHRRGQLANKACGAKEAKAKSGMPACQPNASQPALPELTRTANELAAEASAEQSARNAARAPQSEPQGNSNTGRLSALLPTHIVKTPLTWWIAGQFALQSILFYCLVAWIPSMLAARGISSASISLCVTLFPMMGIFCTVFVPPLAQRTKDQRALGAATGLLIVAGIALTGFAHSDAMAIFSVAFLGLALGAPFSLCMFYFSERAACAEDSARLSSISQTFGYLLAAAGPVCMGALFDATGTWTMPFSLMIIMGAALTICSWKAGKGSLPAA